ncbi:MAG: dihydroorotase [Holosporaceae bacterium]|nr:dihydroorotase [Holosporaceae bacterium]
MNLLIKNGRVVDPSQGLDAIADVLISDGKIAKIDGHIEGSNVEVFDAKGLVVAPGFIDAHTHLREPGYEGKEDIESGTKAAAAGGITTVFCMANTDPVIDSSILVSGLKERIARKAAVNVEVIGAVTKGLKGEELAEMGDMAEAGAIAFSDDGRWIANSRIFRSALEYASAFDKIIISHAEDETLAAGGYMNEGLTSTKLGIPGIPAAAEDIAVARDIILAELTGARLHVAHVSTKGAVELIRQAKARGVKVTAEATVHHMTLTDSAVVGYNTAAKVSPPLRTAEHVEAVRRGVKDGTIDIIVTDHAPHSFKDKDVEFRYAPNGAVGLETSIAVALTDLYHTGILTLEEMIDRMSAAPSRLFSLDRGNLKIGSRADVTILDLNKEWTIEGRKFYSKSKLTPFEGKRRRGKAAGAIVNGKIVMKDGIVL